MQNALEMRIFDKKGKRMIYAPEARQIGISLSLAGEVLQFQDGKMYPVDECVVMRKTPHTSVKGGHIWEGDICDFDAPNEFGSTVRARGFMAFDPRMKFWRVRITAPKEHPALGTHELLFNLVIVGNLYDTPELLDKTP